MNEESRPAKAAPNDLAGGLISFKRNALYGAPVEKPLDRTLWMMLEGQIGLHDLTPSLAGFYYAGHADGIGSLQARIAYLEHTADRLYVAAFNDRDLAKRIQQRMDEHYRVKLDALMRGDEVLHEWRESQFPKENPLGYFASGVTE